MNCPSCGENIPRRGDGVYQCQNPQCGWPGKDGPPPKGDPPSWWRYACAKDLKDLVNTMNGYEADGYACLPPVYINDGNWKWVVFARQPRPKGSY
jgi:hypothetical protein